MGSGGPQEPKQQGPNYSKPYTAIVRVIVRIRELDKGRQKLFLKRENVLLVPLGCTLYRASTWGLSTW